MKTQLHFFWVVIVALWGQSLFAQNIQNPVLPKVADAGVMKYNGKYYIGGVNTFGDFYISEDLVKWEGPFHVVTMDNDWTKGTGAKNNQIHANDLLYYNGEFHLYWSVNYWGEDRHAVHIVHAQSDSVTGPYTEPQKKHWLDNRIDPKVFKDDDGQLYMYMVRFTDGNTIWGRKMKNPGEFAGEPVCLFASLPNTWETMDNRVAEGPWVIKYRDRYYMMYNANHTSTEWGNYQLGVAEADSPLAFQHGNKYSYPVVVSNQMVLEERYVDVLRYDTTYTPLFSYTVDRPEGKWVEPDYDATAWESGAGGFASDEIEGSTVRKLGTRWDTPSLWLRKQFDVSDPKHNFALRVTHNGDTKIYLNGTLIYEKSGRDYCIVNLNKEQKRALKQGGNILAVETEKGRTRNFFDLALFDMGCDKADDILITPGQPNIVRGPNGFEWWLVYMANKNDEPRGQHIDRVQFFDKTLYVDGITGPHTTGYHPAPSQPTFSCVDEVPSFGLLDDFEPALSYLFETNVKTTTNAGVVAWWQDSANCAYVGLDEKTNSWYLRIRLDGKETLRTFALPADFRWGVYHQLRVERNNTGLRVWLDEIPAPGVHRLSGVIPDNQPGRAGVFAEDNRSLFAGSVYTIGFDDVDMTLNRGEQKILGEPLDAYEFSFQLYGLSGERSAGCYPLYVDAENYVKAVFNGETGMLDVVSVKNGRQLWTKSFPLAGNKIVYPDVKYTDFIEKTYKFANPVWLDSIYLSRHDADNELLFAQNMFDHFDVSYLAEGEWYPIDDLETGVCSHPAYNYAKLPKLKVDGLRFINKNATDLQRHIYKIGIHECLKESYNLRVVRRADQMYLFVDGRELGSVKVDSPKSRIGFYAIDYAPEYKGILYYHIGGE